MLKSLLYSFLPAIYFMSHDSALHAMHVSLTELGLKQISIGEFCRVWREQHALLAALPPRFAVVMEDLLGRLEAGSLFTEESCSFSQTDLHATLSMWLDKAKERMQAN